MRRKLSILGKSWKVRKTKQPKLNGKPCYGLFDPDKKTIYIKSGMTKRETLRVFWHEYTHARLYESGVTLNAGGLSALAEEIICDTFADLLAYEIDTKWKRKR